MAMSSSGSSNRRAPNPAVRPRDSKREVANENDRAVRDMERGVVEDEREIVRLEERIRELGRDPRTAAQAKREVDRLRHRKAVLATKQKNLKFLRTKVADFSATIETVEVHERVSQMGKVKSSLLGELNLAEKHDTGDRSAAVDMALDELMEHVGITGEMDAQDQAENDRLFDELMAGDPGAPELVKSASAGQVARSATPNNTNGGARAKYKAVQELIDF